MARTAWEHILRGEEPEEGLNQQRSRLLGVLAQRAAKPAETVQDRIDRLCAYYHDVLYQASTERGLSADGQALGKIAQAITTEVGVAVIVTFIPMSGGGLRLVGYALPMPPISAETRAILEKAQVATLKRLHPGVK